MLISIGQDNDKVNFISSEVYSIDELAEAILKTPYSLGTFKNNYRNKENFIQTRSIGLDFDEGLTLEKATELFKEYAHIIAPTRSHRVEKNGVVQDRFRVVLFLQYPITDNETFEATWFSLANKWPNLDKACKDASRFFYPSKFIHSISSKGKKIDPVLYKPPVVNNSSSLVDNESDQLLKGRLGKRTLEFLTLGAKEGEKHNELYAAARDANQQGFAHEWFLEKLEGLAQHCGEPKYLDHGALKTVADAFSKDPKHEPRIEPKAFRLLKIGELYKDKTEVEWLVAQLLSKGGISLVSADPKAGKSTLVRQLIREVLRGTDFLGRKCKQGKVFYFAIEEQKQVVNASFRRLGVNDTDELYIHVGDPLTGNVFADFREVLLEVKPELAVIDTLFDFLEVESENNYREVKKELRRLRQVARESGTHILLVHHNSKGQKDDKRRGNRGILGSQAIAGGVDTIMVIEVDGSSRLITSSGREIRQWNHREIIYNDKDHSYTLGPEREDFE